MSFRQKLQYHLVKKLGISNKDASNLIVSSQVKVNQNIVIENIQIKPLDEIEILNQNNQIYDKKYYLILNKPVGIESTLNPDIENNLLPFLPQIKGLFHIGRLDKESEGLMLFSNEGKIHDKILRNKNQEVLKKYLVEVDSEIDEDFIAKMESGIEILGTKTLPCKLEKLDSNSFYIWLNQGLNRQIRRMCYKLEKEVTKLQRLEIGEIKLDDLEMGKLRALNFDEISYLKNLF